MDTGAALTLVFAGIGALGTLYSVTDGFARRGAERRREREAIEARWSMTARSAWRAGHFHLTLKCVDVTDSPITLVSIRAVAPASTLLCEAKLVPTGGVPVAEPLDDVWTTELIVGRDLSGIFAWSADGAMAQIDYALLDLIAKPPRECAGSRGRFRLAIVIEERTAARRRRHLQIASQDVAFTAQVDPDAV